ncbi:MAG: polymer-forming cytoskeletal protein [Paenibacillus dendritiformis]|uniref:polymer-forming cytoskeletal protein n=1 Tax=uncultured Paenibacillus sp. TaxID=227322 RepID=UPI0025F9D10F|nr:polymer-forming cytoskeletal protein [uncultured Paenibacillus sp.]MDU5145601.1 polymer-forming cytoskeletal protein [Paenibacillus dendritiformis]
MSQATGDLMISGLGSSSGGTYQRVRIDGMGSIDGDLVCSSFASNGKGKVTGNLEADTMEVRGMLTLQGNLQSDHSRIDGTARLDGHWSGDEIELNGTATVAYDCQAERFVSRGAFHIGGLLNAGTIDVKMAGGCRAREIGCERILVRQGAALSIFNKLFSSFTNRPKLEADTIEGDIVDLEYTRARVVRGNHVTIGPGCQIDQVEYRQSVQLHEEAQVNSRRKL